jgi:hypothetical protein
VGKYLEGGEMWRQSLLQRHLSCNYSVNTLLQNESITYYSKITAINQKGPNTRKYSIVEVSRQENSSVERQEHERVA